MKYVFIQITKDDEILGSIHLDYDTDEERDSFVADVEKNAEELDEEEFWEWIENHERANRFHFDLEITI